RELTRAARDQHDARSGPAELESQRRPQPLARAGHQRSFALQFHPMTSVPWRAGVAAAVPGGVALEARRDPMASRTAAPEIRRDRRNGGLEFISRAELPDVRTQPYSQSRLRRCRA